MVVVGDTTHGRHWARRYGCARTLQATFMLQLYVFIHLARLACKDATEKSTVAVICTIALGSVNTSLDTRTTQVAMLVT